MKELTDYSGPFVRDIKFEDLSKKTLAKLLRVYCKEVLTMDAYWQQQMAKHAGEEISRQCLLENWCRMGKHEMKWTMEALNIRGNDIEAYIKVNQFLPSFAQGIFDYDWELVDKNHAILTVRHCTAFAAFKERDPEKLNWMCTTFEQAGMDAYTVVLNPAIKSRPLKVGYHGDPDEIACKWEFYIE
jgi:hypothetical protein